MAIFVEEESEEATNLTQNKCTLNHCLEWDKWALTNFEHDRQWFNTFIPPSHESTWCALFVAPSRTAISRLSGPWNYQYVILRQTSIVEIDGTSETVE